MKQTVRGAALWMIAAIGLAASSALPGAARAEPELVAEEITAERFAALRVGGPDADAGAGDWALQNGTLCAAVSAPGHESPLAPTGGVLIDLGHCGAEDDQWSTLQPLVNLDRGDAIPMESIHGEVTAREARVVTTGGRAGVRIQTVFTLGLANPEILVVETELTRTSNEGFLFAFADVALHASGQLRPFGLLRRDLERSPGFVHPAGDPFSMLSMLGAIVSADAYVLVGGDAIEPAISYGLVLRSARIRYSDGETAALPTFANSGESHTMMGFFGGPLFFGGADPPGMLAFAQLPFLSLSAGDSLIIERTIHVGRRNDVASVTDSFFADGATVHGRVVPEARLHVASPTGAPVTQVRPDPDGSFAFRLPTGFYRVRVRTPWGESTRELSLVAGGVDMGTLETAKPARVTLPRGATLRAIFVGTGGTPNPVFGDDLLGLTVGDRAIEVGLQSNAVSLAGVESDPEAVALAPGRYRVLASRGPEYTVTETTLDVSAGQEISLELEVPRRAIETPGWIGADLHVHSAESFDSSFPLRDQVRAFAAFGGEVLVGTEHDRVFDPGPTVEALGLGGRLASIVGVEATSAYPGGDSPFTVGHLNALPVPYEPTTFRGGAPDTEGRRLRDIIDDLRALPSSTLVQLNHPRDKFQVGVEEGSYFTHLAVVGEAYDPTLPLQDEPNLALIERGDASGTRDLDYDAVELLNGGSMDRYRITRADWFSLLLQGVVHTGTANSDTHRAGRLAAMPRNYVPVADDDPAMFEQRGFIEAIRGGRSYGSTGPVLDVSLGGVGIGGSFAGSEADLVVGVAAAPWVTPNELRVFVNGELEDRRKIQAGQELTIPLRFPRDSFVTVEVEGPRTEIYSAIAPGFTPFAFSNPIFVDTDGDGQWTAPGLPADLPDTLAHPLASP